MNCRNKLFVSLLKTFMEEMTRKQPDVDKITKTHKRKATADPPVQSHIPVLDKGRTVSEYQSSVSIKFGTSLHDSHYYEVCM